MRNKKLISTFLAITVMFTGCSEKHNKAETSNTGAGNNILSQSSPQYNGTDITSSEAAVNQTAASETKNPKLKVICDKARSCMTDKGYYYITEDLHEIKGKNYAYKLMYMDFKTKQEIYLCNEPGCRHNDKNCTAILPSDEFEADCLILQSNGKLYIVNRDYDTENEVSADIIWSEDGTARHEPPKVPIVTIYSMNPDGTKRTKEYSFEPDISLEETVLSDGESLYFVTKKIKAETEKGKTYFTTTKRQIEKYLPDSNTTKKVCSLDFNDNIQWKVIGCSGEKIIIHGTKYNKNLSLKESMELSPEDSWEHRSDSKEIYASITFSDNSLKELYSIKNDTDDYNDAVVHGDFLYATQKSTKKVWSINLTTGKKTTLTTLKQNHIVNCLSDKLCCMSWNTLKDYNLYFVDLNSGKVNRCTLVNKCNGWNIDIIGDIGDDVLTIYDYEATTEDGEEYDITKYQYGLINKKDLYNSNDSFKKIAMKENGI